ncbi:hypothetical protein HMPREF1988_00536 [Porphyromonas gingivalis F0185]|nr:hypothetical protein HMPREF1553_00907 [Porphyromonas gingivalis F0568]ERJ85072.1 hypothetical protein HMPREF1988_00536 [Porphyromonas gingivalis F0185]
MDSTVQANIHAKTVDLLLNTETNVQNQRQKPYICFRNRMPYRI